MLATLRIKNLALVDDLTVELQPGFNGISGETGAGKSILIGALNLALGERADRTAIRGGADSCTVEAVFRPGELLPEINSFLDENGLEPCDGDQLLLRRSFTAAGANRQFINGSPTTLQVLKALGELLVDIHGPHEHQSLLQPARQLDILDAFGGLEKERSGLEKLTRDLRRIEGEKAELVVDEETYARQLDLLRHQVTEIEAARLSPGEEEEVEAEHQRAGNGAELLQLCQTALNQLAEGDGALLDQAGELGRTLHELERIDPATGELAEIHARAIESWNELQSQLGRYADRVEVDPERLAELEERLNVIQSLKRKYGQTVEVVIAFGTEAREKLASLESRDARLAGLNTELADVEKRLAEAAKSLGAKRRTLVGKLAKRVTAELRELGFLQSHFEISLEVLERVIATGRDAIEFLFAPNVGEAPKPLRAIASSGEMARVMLALKTVLAAQDRVPVLVFDEVDANVGGETANVVGRKMQEIGARRQVLCITHLPAVAAAAHAHYEVRKRVENGRTISEITSLSGDQRVAEISRMLGGRSDAARKHAEALLSEQAAERSVGQG